MNSFITRIATDKDFNRLIKFKKNLYKYYPAYRDNQTSMIKSLLIQKMEIQKKSEIIPILVEEGNDIVGMAFLACIDRMKNFLQISFLEIQNDKRIFISILDFAKKFAKEKNIKKILIGMNLHVNYGLGLLTNNFEKRQSIGSSYNPPYYIDIIEHFSSKTIILKSYSDNISSINLDNLSSAMKKRIDKFEIRFADFKNIKKTAKIYSYINNLAFAKHNYYYESRDEENIELFNNFKILLKPENLIFAFYKNKPVAFILWYPDFNQLVKSNCELGLSAFFRSKFFPNSIDTIKFTEFGVIPEFQKTAAILSLLKKCYDLNKNRYKYIESGWILDDNLDSKNLVTKFLKKESKIYKVFEIDLI